MPSSVRLLGAGGATVSTLTVPGEGTYDVDTTNGRVTFTPLPGFTGVATPVPYRVTDALGAVATSTVTVTVAAGPVAAPDVAQAQPGTPVTTAVLTDDSPGLVPSTLRLVGPGGVLVTTLTTTDGTYTAAPDGTLTFLPRAGFSGVTTPVTYSVADGAGVRATSTYTVTVTAAAPVARPDEATGTPDQPVTIDVLGNDAGGSGAALVPASVRLLDPATGLPATVVVQPGTGTWTVNGAGRITFTPVAGFTGVAALRYQVADASGRLVVASVSVRVSAAGGSGGAGGELPFTGSYALRYAGAGLLSLLLGSGLLLLARRRPRLG